MIEERVERELWTNFGLCRIVVHSLVTPHGTFRLRRYYYVAGAWLRTDDRGTSGEELPRPAIANDNGRTWGFSGRDRLRS